MSETVATTDDRESFADRMVDLRTGTDLLSERLGLAFDMARDLGHAPGEDGAYVVEAVEAVRWVAKRLGEDISTGGREFDQDLSNHRKVKFAQAAE